MVHTGELYNCDMKQKICIYVISKLLLQLILRVSYQEKCLNVEVLPIARADFIPSKPHLEGTSIKRDFAFKTHGTQVWSKYHFPSLVCYKNDE